VVEASVILAVRDMALASSLELALLAGGFAPRLHDPEGGLEGLALEGVGALIVGPQVLNERAGAFIEGLRARPWDGLVVLITGDGEKLRDAVAACERVAVLEMPFVGADLIAVVHAAWPAG
jgi:hypothetical protein